MKQLKGVNLGGWLVLEPWITPSLFKGLLAQDEFGLCTELGSIKRTLLSKHRNNFVTKKDFEWIAEQGFNAVRLPVGHWLFGDYAPYVEAQKYVQKALDWAQEYELAVIIDLHTAPGSQNGEMHSGKMGEIAWHTQKGAIEQTSAVLEKIARTYGKHPSLYGIEVLNEPSKYIPISIIQKFYNEAYVVIRKHSDCKIIMSDAYHALAVWKNFIYQPNFTDVLLDVHIYQVYGRYQKFNYPRHLQQITKWRERLSWFDPQKIIVGEWSTALHEIYGNMDADQEKQASKLYYDAQQYAFSKTTGQFYWNYKTEGDGQWNYQWLKSNLL